MNDQRSNIHEINFNPSSWIDDDRFNQDLVRTQPFDGCAKILMHFYHGRYRIVNKTQTYYCKVIVDQYRHVASDILVHSSSDDSLSHIRLQAITWANVDFFFSNRIQGTDIITILCSAFLTYYSDSIPVKWIQKYIFFWRIVYTYAALVCCICFIAYRSRLFILLPVSKTYWWRWVQYEPIFMDLAKLWLVNTNTIQNRSFLWVSIVYPFGLHTQFNHLS